MSTRSRIGIVRDNGKIEHIYCHSDGYPAWNGKILENHYQDIDKINQLIALGDISSLDAEIGEKHNFNDLDKNWVRSYGRDRGETCVASIFSENKKEYIRVAENSWAEYLYLFQDKWFVYAVNDKNPKWRTVKETLK